MDSIGKTVLHARPGCICADIRGFQGMTSAGGGASTQPPGSVVFEAITIHDPRCPLAAKEGKR